MNAETEAGRAVQARFDDPVLRNLPRSAGQAVFVGSESRSGAHERSPRAARSGCGVEVQTESRKGRRRHRPVRHPRLLLPVVVLTSALALAGCTGATPGPTRGSATPAVAVVRFTQRSADDPAVIDAATAPERAVQASRAFFAASPGVVVAPDGDHAAQQRAGAAAQRLHVPLLLVPRPAAPSAAPSASASTPPSASSTTPPSAAPSSSPSASADAEQIAAVTAEVRRLGATWTAGQDAPRIAGVRRLALDAAPSVQAPAPPAGVAIASSEDADTAALATASAAGSTVVSNGDSLVPGATSEAVDALQGSADAPVALIGSRFADLRDPAWGIAAARTGYQYAGGGQVPFDGHRLFVALYGTPGAPVLGVLGEQEVSATIARAEALAKRYRPLTKRTVAPMLEMIATVASGSPTDDGDYSSAVDTSELETYIDAAAEAGMPVVLDLQPGRSDFLTQAKELRKLLEKPNVGLALDPEWRLEPGQRPLVQIGTVSADEVNRTSAWLADLVKQKGLPPKPLVLHQFQLRMLQDRDAIVVDRPQLDVLIHVDGQGTQPEKQATWSVLHQDAPDVAWGWKNFIDEDHPTLTPQETIDQVHPTPDLITYQ